MFELGTDGPSVIVSGIDGSESSMRAGAYAAGLARRQGSKLVLVYIAPIGGGVNAMAVAATAQLGGETAADLRRQISRAVQRMPEAPAWEFIVESGDPFNGLVEVAVRLRADAVVIGASQSTGHRIIGSVAVRLVKAGRWPVTVVP